MTVIVAIDAGTTGVRTFAVDEHGSPRGWSYREFPQYFPRPGWVEHDADEILAVTLEVLADVARGDGGCRRADRRDRHHEPA